MTRGQKRTLTKYGLISSQPESFNRPGVTEADWDQFFALANPELVGVVSERLSGPEFDEDFAGMVNRATSKR